MKLNFFDVIRSNNIRIKISIFAQDVERKTLLRFQSLLKHRQENNFSIDKHHLKNKFKYKGNIS